MTNLFARGARTGPLPLAARALVFGLLLLATACWGAQSGLVQGALTSVDANSLTRAERITLRDNAGKVWTFAVASDATSHGGPISTGHLRQHLGLGEAITVHYRTDAGVLIATRIDD